MEQDQSTFITDYCRQTQSENKIALVKFKNQESDEGVEFDTIEPVFTHPQYPVLVGYLLDNELYCAENIDWLRIVDLNEIYDDE